MDDEEQKLRELLHVNLTWNTPLSANHAERLLAHLDVRPRMRILDLGCGWGELLLRALAKVPDVLGEGVDSDHVALERGRRNAASRGLSHRVQFTLADLPHSHSIAERVICIGASHAWGGTDSALGAVRRHLSSGGRALFGDGFWTRPPTQQLIEMFGGLQSSLAELVTRATAAGFRPLFVDTATETEWDEFEGGTYRGLEEFALGGRPAELSAKARERAEVRRNEYLAGYRGVLGFAYLVLANP
jgi:SAM-dependent methyltransferase